MNRDWLMEEVKRQMPAKRWAHTLGVMESAVQLARRFGGDETKADLAALLHDYCKFWPIDRQERLIADNGLAGDLLEYDKALLHAPAAAWIAREHYGITDEEVLDAIRYHTSGRAGMTKLDKIVCLADYIEPGRDFPGVHTIRELADNSLEKALIAGFDSTLTYLIAKQQIIYPLTVIARNSLVRELGRVWKLRG
ncbi:bis(5'-nucleosyl)-tetraphosphatase (symmetrical) YqeK [Paenibacillus cymbidii]|uniref:bis(5'-nucleosyl)-tetraphosphatase (symmetrical) YqeK n=1 Tax=Paenibacillus cymbidii TaxID=1639034 RepID=UPI001080267A|nr:bis(5'-nucleosyl)-tetraphosphatase (symmetrical) YqeK [Paenibacillus cymbidii]